MASITVSISEGNVYVVDALSNYQLRLAVSDTEDLISALQAALEHLTPQKFTPIQFILQEQHENRTD